MLVDGNARRKENHYQFRGNMVNYYAVRISPIWKRESASTNTVE